MKCVFDARWVGRHGIGRFASEVRNRIEAIDLVGQSNPASPLDPFRLPLALDRLPLKSKWFFSPGYNAPILGQVPYVLTIHDVNHIDRPENSGLGKRAYYASVLSRLVRRAHLVLTVSEFSRMRICEVFAVQPSRIINVGNGISKAFASDVLAADFGYEYVLCVSNRRGHKNEEGALAGFMAARLPEYVKLVFTGEASSALFRVAANLRADGRVIFAGKLSEDELVALYRGAKFLLFPSYYEGFGLPIVEAFASGIPVITSNRAAMPEVAGDSALLVDPASVDSIAEAVRQLYFNSKLRSQLIGRGKLRCERYSWSNVVQRIRSCTASLGEI